MVELHVADAIGNAVVKIHVKEMFFFEVMRDEWRRIKHGAEESLIHRRCHFSNIGDGAMFDGAMFLNASFVGDHGTSHHPVLIDEMNGIRVMVGRSVCSWQFMMASNVALTQAADQVDRINRVVGMR